MLPRYVSAAVSKSELWDLLLVGPWYYAVILWITLLSSTSCRARWWRGYNLGLFLATRPWNWIEGIWSQQTNSKHPGVIEQATRIIWEEVRGVKTDCWYTGIQTGELDATGQAGEVNWRFKQSSSEMHTSEKPELQEGHGQATKRQMEKWG